MRATFKLLNSYFWKTIYGPIIAFVLPVLLLLVLGNIMRVQYVYPGIIALSLLFIGILALPLSIMELKSSSLFKYIGASPVDNKKFSIVAIGYYVFIAFITVFIILCATMAFSKMHLFNAGDVVFDGGFKYGVLGGIFFTVKGVISFVVAILLHLFMVIAFGLAIATFAKTPQQALTFSIVIIIPSMFLSGMILSVDIIAQSAVMQWVSRLIPFRYTTGNIVVASTPIDQLGDVLSLLSFNEKSIIFKDGTNPANPFGGLQKDGTITYTFTPVDSALISAHPELLGKTITIRTSDDLFNYIAEYANDGGATKIDSTFIPFMKKDQEILLKLVIFKEIGKNQFELLPASDNNIFDWTQAWGVRRIPEVEQIKEFITKYFQGGESANGGDAGRFGDLWDSIQKNDYSWLNLFLKQNNTLYVIADRVLNVCLPIALSSGSLFYVSKKFKWSSR